MTESAAGAIWRVTAEGSEVWLQDELLAGPGELVPGLPVGTNGIDVH